MYYDPAREFSDGELERIRRRLAKEYSEAASAMEERQRVLMASYERERSQMAAAMGEEAFERWCEGQAARSEWIGSMSDTLAGYAADADRTAVGGLRDHIADVFAESANWAAFDVESRALVDTAFTLLDRDAVMELARDDPKLLPTPRVDIPKDMAWNRRHMSSALTQGIMRGESVGSIASRLRSVIDMDRRAAMRTARTAVNHAENAGKMSSYRRAAAMGIGLRKEWAAALDDRTRDSHRYLDGERRPLDEPFSNGLMEPGDPDGAPAEVYNCRCRVIAVPDGVDTSGAERNSRLGTMSYEQWKEGRHGGGAYTYSVVRETPIAGSEYLQYPTPIVDVVGVYDEAAAQWEEAMDEAFEGNGAHHMTKREAVSQAERNIDYMGRDLYDSASEFFGPGQYQAVQRAAVEGSLPTWTIDLDDAIDSFEFPQDTALVRRENIDDILGRVLGKGAAPEYALLHMSDEGITDALMGSVISGPGYSSTSFAPLHSSLVSDTDTMLNIVAREGTPALIREGGHENEVLLGRGTEFHVVGVRILHAQEWADWEDDVIDVRRIVLDVVV